MKLVFLFIILAISQGEAASSLPPGKYISWVNDSSHGLVNSNTFGNYVFSLQFTPLEYLAIKEFGTDSISSELIAEYTKEMDSLQYFILRISTKNLQGDVLKEGIANPSEYHSRVQYFANYMQQDISLYEGKEVLPCVFLHYERDYNLSPYQTFILAFPKAVDPKALSDKILHYNDRALNLGTVQLTITAKSISDIPKLKID